MKEHSFRTIELGNKNRRKKKTLVSFSDASYDIAADFFNGEMESFHNEICAELTRMKEEGTQARFSGNRISFAADSEKTLIYEDRDDEMRWCEIGTDELSELIREWEQEKEKEKS